MSTIKFVATTQIFTSQRFDSMKIIPVFLLVPCLRGKKLPTVSGRLCKDFFTFNCHILIFLDSSPRITLNTIGKRLLINLLEEIPFPVPKGSLCDHSEFLFNERSFSF